MFQLRNLVRLYTGSAEGDLMDSVDRKIPS